MKTKEYEEGIVTIEMPRRDPELHMHLKAIWDKHSLLLSRTAQRSENSGNALAAFGELGHKLCVCHSVNFWCSSSGRGVYPFAHAPTATFRESRRSTRVPLTGC